MLAAVEHLSEVRGQELADAAAALPDGTPAHPGGARDARRPLHRPVFTAALELWVAARTDPGLPAAVGPLEQRIGREVHRHTVELLGVDETQPGVRELVQATLDLVRGLGLANTITDDTARRRRILDHWADVLDSSAAAPRPTTPRTADESREEEPMSTLDDVLADLKAEGDQLDDLVAAARRRGLAHADPRRGLGRRPPDRPPGVDRRDRGQGGHRQGGLGRDRARGDRRPRRLRRRGGRRRCAGPARRAARPVAGRPCGAGRRCCGEYPADQKLPWYGPPMSATSMATARFMETWAHARDVADALGVTLPQDDRVRHVVHLGVRTRGFAFASNGLRRPPSRSGS